MKFVDIICATYNCQDKVPLFIANLKKIDFNLANFIVCDGGSTDGTIEQLKKASFLTLVDSKKDHGIYDAWNKCLTHLKSEYVAFIGIDDIINPKFIEEAFDCFNNKIQPAIFYGDGLIKFYEYKKIVTTPPNPLLLSDKSIIKFDLIHQGLFIRSNLLKDYKFNLSYKLSADLVFFLDKKEDILLHGYFKIDKCFQSEIDFNGMSTQYKAIKTYKIEHKKIYDRYKIKIHEPLYINIAFYLSFNEWSFKFLRKLSWSIKRVCFEFNN